MVCAEFHPNKAHSFSFIIKLVIYLITYVDVHETSINLEVGMNNVLVPFSVNFFFTFGHLIKSNES